MHQGRNTGRQRVSGGTVPEYARRSIRCPRELSDQVLGSRGLTVNAPDGGVATVRVNPEDPLKLDISGHDLAVEMALSNTRNIIDGSISGLQSGGASAHANDPRGGFPGPVPALAAGGFHPGIPVIGTLYVAYILVPMAPSLIPAWRPRTFPHAALPLCSPSLPAALHAQPQPTRHCQHVPVPPGGPVQPQHRGSGNNVRPRADLHSGASRPGPSQRPGRGTPCPPGRSGHRDAAPVPSAGQPQQQAPRVYEGIGMSPYLAGGCHEIEIAEETASGFYTKESGLWRPNIAKLPAPSQE